MGLANLARHFIGQAREVTDRLTISARELAIQLESQTAARRLPQTSASIRALPAALISHLVSISGGRQNAILGGGTQESWRGLMPRVANFDESTLKHTSSDSDLNEHAPTLDYTIKLFDDYSPRQLPKNEVDRLARKSLTYAAHVERSAHAWNVAHAIEVLRAFTELQNINVPDAPWLKHTVMLERGRFRSTNEAGVFPDMQESFSALTRHLSISRTMWDTIALPLHAAYTLERVNQTHQARRIATEIVQRELEKATKASV